MNTRFQEINAYSLVNTLEQNVLALEWIAKHVYEGIFGYFCHA